MELYCTTNKNKYEVNIPQGRGEYYTQCPVCSYQRKPQNQKKKCFGWSRDKNIGHCSHCNSSFVEFHEFEKQDTTTNEPQTKLLSKINSIPFEYLKRSLGVESNFGDFLKHNFKEEEINEIMKKYYLGMTKDRSVIFWYIDIENRIRSGKIIQYDSETGKRVKESSIAVVGAGSKPALLPIAHVDPITPNPNNENKQFSRAGLEPAPTCNRKTNQPPISWVHSQMKKNNQLPLDWNFTRCLFGEHLLKNNPNANICLVESEKTAIIASVYMPNEIWLATGGKEMFNENVCRVLKGRKVIIFPDLGATPNWREKAIEISNKVGCTMIISEILERLANEEDKEKGLDIADYLLKLD